MTCLVAFNNLKRVVMKSVKALALGLMMVAGSANAAVTATLTAASDYSLRGISQNAKSAVLQGSLDYSRDNGFYLGLFLSAVDFENNGSRQPALGYYDSTDYFHLERSLYSGYKIELDDDMSLDLGGKYYTYNANSLNHGELYTALTYKSSLKASVYYSPNFINGSGANEAKPLSKAAYGIAVDGTKALPADFSVLAHVGYNTGEYWTDNGSKSAYIDYAAGFGYKMGKVDWALQYVNTNTTLTKGNRITTDKMNNANRLVLSVSTKLPW